MADLWSFLYVSDLAPGQSAEIVAEIALKSRASNHRDDLTGLLIFDGAHFAQIVEGPEAPIRALLERLKKDPRHDGLEVLYSSAGTGPRRFPQWRLGYLTVDLQEFDVPSLRGQVGPKALEAFEFMLPALDLDLGQKMPSEWLRPG